MKAIFFDLETSDKNPVGQIINYCFIVVNRSYEIIDELSGLVNLSRLQLPSPGAILANRTDVMKHQELAKDSEPEAMRKIFEFISRVVATEDKKVALIGYNSSRFDIPYLRTSLIRNGLNPYFSGKLVYRDLLFASKKLAVIRSDFPRTAKDEASEEAAGILSLSLENLSHRLGLLKGKQTHESRDDVILTIELAKTFKEKFMLDTIDQEAYEVGAQHTNGPNPVLTWVLYPEYDLKAEKPVKRVPMCLLDYDYRSALWIDLDRYQKGEGRKSISWFNKASSQFVSGGAINENNYSNTASKALEEFKEIKVANFFPRSTCDIEQDIYRLDMQRIETLRRAIWDNDSSAIASVSDKDTKVLWIRHRLANYIVPASWNTGNSKKNPEQLKFENTLKQYAEYRYGGKLQLFKTIDLLEESSRPEAFAPTLQQLLDELRQSYQRGNDEDKEVLASLFEFYRQSDMVRLLGLDVAQDYLESASRVDAVTAPSDSVQVLQP